MEGPTNKIERRQIPSDDPEYIEAREQSRKVRSATYFGQYGLSKLKNATSVHTRMTEHVHEYEALLAGDNPISDENRERMMFNLEQTRSAAEETWRGRGSVLRKDFTNLITDFTNLIARDYSEKRKSYVFEEIKDMCRGCILPIDLQEAIVSEDMSLVCRLLADGIASGEISDEVLGEMASTHAEKVMHQKEVLAMVAEQVKVEFKEAVTARVTTGDFPNSALALLPQIDSLEVVLSDRLSDIFSGVQGSINVSGIISVSNEQIQESLLPRLRHTLMHEFLHEISGRSITIEKEYHGDSTATNYFHRKSGLSIHNPDTNYHPFTWLNEAVTEWLAMELSGYHSDDPALSHEGSSSYPFERLGLDVLFRQGLDPRFVMEAYFEQITTGQLKAEKGKHFTRLVAEINRVAGPYAFSKLENRAIVREVSDQLLSMGLVRRVPRNVRLDGQSLYKVSVKVGYHQEVVEQRDFYFSVRNSGEYAGTVLPDDFMMKVRDELMWIKNCYPNKVVIDLEQVDSEVS